MSINLEKNRQLIVSAWKDVLDDKTATDWALFGYEGQTNDLKVVETGDGGLDELSDEFNSGKIMYAFVRIADPKTSLNKYVLINWQGEGARRKGTCANHIRDVEKLLNGAHLTINARVEDDVEKELIFEKVSAVGSAYSFKEHKFTEETQKGPIGTAYSRCNPAKEINAKERDSFWKKEEEEEKKRVILEKERKKIELIKTEEERRVREEKEHTERERRIAMEINAAPMSTNNNNFSATARSPVMPLSPTIHQQTESRGPTQAELMRQQRNQEAKELIGSRVGTAKAIFSQNSASGQMHTKAAPAKPVRNSIAQRINSLTNQQQQTTEMKKTNFIDECKPANVVVTSPIQENNEIYDKFIVNEKEKQIEQKEVEEADDNAVIEIKENEIFETVEEIENNEILTNGKIINKNNEKIKQQEEIIPIIVEETAPSPQPEYDNDDDDDDQYSTIKRSPHNKTGTTTTTTTATITSQAATPVDDYNLEERTTNLSINNKTMDEQNQNDLMSDDSIIFPDMLGDILQRARALYDYQAADESEISFDPNDIITHIDQIDEGWWQGLGPDGTYGLFPANYVELIKD